MPMICTWDTYLEIKQTEADEKTKRPDETYVECAVAVPSERVPGELASSFNFPMCSPEFRCLDIAEVPVIAGWLRSW
jgi:hypothetical protein